MKHALPLRTRLALSYSIFFAVTLLLLDAGVLFGVRAALYQEVFSQLRASSDLVQQDFDNSDRDLTSYFDQPNFLLRTHPPRVEGLESPSLYVQAVAPDGSVVVRSSSLQTQTLTFSAADLRAALAGRVRQTITELGAARVMSVVRPLRADAVIVGMLQVAQPLREVDRTLNLLLGSLALTSCVALVAATSAGAMLARQALQPVQTIARTAQQIVHARDLAQRIPDAPVLDEIGALTQIVNEMLARLETLFTAQQRFVADVSHELRTPLTALRGNLEMIQRGAARDPQALAESLTDSRRELDRLVRLANDLLVLAQADSGALVRRGVVSLDELVLEVVRELQQIAGAVALTPVLHAQVELPGDRDRIKQALINLVVNALQHTPPGGSVQVALGLHEEWARVQVIDTGAGIAPDDLPRVFDRFYRADAARTRQVGGAGLGLAIVQWVAEAHGGQVHVCSTPGQGSTFTLLLPLQATARSSA